MLVEATQPKALRSVLRASASRLGSPRPTCTTFTRLSTLSPRRSRSPTHCYTEKADGRNLTANKNVDCRFNFLFLRGGFRQVSAGVEARVVGLRHVQGQGAAELSVIPSTGRSSDAQLFVLLAHCGRQRPGVGCLPSARKEGTVKAEARPSTKLGSLMLRPNLECPFASFQASHIFKGALGPRSGQRCDNVWVPFLQGE